jgi:predicted O-linked N-acetylglucosamine transferase (SPINDLY family)
MASLGQTLDHAIEYHQQGHLRQAEQLYRQILQVDPRNIGALHLLGVLAHQVGRSDLAIDYLNQALRLNPHFAEAHYNLGVVLKQQGKLTEGVACYQQALRLKPDYAEAHYSLGIALVVLGKLEEAMDCYQQALRCRPDFAEAHNNLGMVQAARGKVDEAVACYRQAVRLKPEFAEAHNNLGNALKDQGRLDEAVACYRRAVQLKADFAAAHSNLVYTLHFCPGFSAAVIFEELRRWSQQHAEPFAKLMQPHANDRSPDRRLRIGYLSPDFRWHPVGRFLLPLLEAHNHKRFEIYCYDSLNVRDHITKRCCAQADCWREVHNLSDEHLAHAIRQDRIDILVDLTMHMGNNRLLVFARKPAPVQVTYLAYCSTTGLCTMDYRLTDPYLDPPGKDECFYSEQSIRLPETYWCYRPIIQTPPVHPLPALRSDQVTFGCLNNFCKVTAPTLAAWGHLLQAQPAARLVLHAHLGSHRGRVREFFAQQNISLARLTFAEKVPAAEYFGLYNGIDVALDPFPYGGGTTTCDALWMGVPVVSLAGQTAVGRGGLSILSNVGLADLVAQDAQEYVHLARKLANDLPRLIQLRATLRARMQASPLMDAARFARDVEASYRGMWHRWCIA